MTMRLDDATSAADPVVRGILGATLAVQVDALDASGDRVGSMWLHTTVTR